jgi:lipoate-protein ligase A
VWPVEHARDDVAVLHGLRPGPGATRAARVCEPSGPAVVLGSAQPDAHVDRDRAAAAGVEVVRRRSGGGAVLVVPGDLAWVDVVVPAGDPLWDDDVGRAFRWVGEAWASALSALGVAGATVHEGALVCRPWSRHVCFGGVGPGEVVVGGRKAVGIAQRRTRHGALFQCAALVRWDVEPLVALLALADEERASARAALADAGLGLGRDAAALADAFVAALP